ncbi:MAG: hypothetical protein K0S39_6042 [Paenibacillus sp.]|jgi:bla regulator protein BlaR1|nr:hypothetical protein [Paenibacillus sp.]
MERLTEHLINLFDWVCSVSIMASVLVMLIIMMQLALKHRLKPRWHYLLWLLVIFRLILPWGPESEFSIYNWIGFTDSIHSAVQVNQEEILAKAAIPETAAQLIYRNLFMIWLVGVCLLGTYTIRINRNFAQKMKEENVTITDERVLKLFHQCKKMMSINKPIALVESCNLTTPTLFGFVKPQLIMPQTLLNSLNNDQLRHVFLHELAHSKRNDIGINWFMHLLLIVHWFNPVLWYAYRRMREDQEIASDALALSYLTPDESQNYGYTLIQLLENFSQPVRVAGNVNLTGSKRQLQRRIKMIKQFKSNSYRWSFLGLATLIFVSGCALTNPKVSQTSTQLSSEADSGEKTVGSASIEQQSTISDDTVKQEASAEQQPTILDNQPSPPIPSAVLQEAPPVEKSRPAPSARLQEAPSIEKSRPVPSPAAQEALSVDEPRPAPPVAVPATPSDNKPRPAPPVMVQPKATK